MTQLISRKPSWVKEQVLVCQTKQEVPVITMKIQVARPGSKKPSCLFTQKTLGVHGPLTDQQVPKPYSEVRKMNNTKRVSYRWEVEISARKQDETVWSTSRA